ncbi:hypothetical protein WJX84_010308 [Apatococcus fuscideae]|uniref:Uncharacterized protein n=1 Tax=Apatococcus fuscideae TaxID=2026836 RepID=A0AAW1TE47_9CHLO
MMVEPTACLAFAAKYSWDEESPQGRRFAGMCGESACLGAMLTEVSTHHLMTSMSWHMYNSLDPNLVRPQDDLQKMKAAGNINREQQLMVKHLWETYIGQIRPMMQDQASLLHDLEGSGGDQCMLLKYSPSQVASTLNQAADLEHSISQQQERYLFMLSRFIFQVLSPFQMGHLSGAAYPFTLQYSDLISSIAEQDDISSVPS